MSNWTYNPRSHGFYLVVWGLLTLAFIPFVGSTAGMVMVGILGLVFCWYGIGMVRTGSWSLT
jgi:hypothetical protein